MKYIIPMIPIAWARPRYNSNTKVFFDKQHNEKEVYRFHIRSQHQGDVIPFRDCPLKLTVTFFMPLPLTEKLREEREKQHYFYSRPDLSNMIKFLEDAVQGFLFEDDCLIVQIDAQKVYNKRGYTEFSIEPI